MPPRSRNQNPYPEGDDVKVRSTISNEFNDDDALPGIQVDNDNGDVHAAAPASAQVSLGPVDLLNVDEDTPT